MPRIPSDSPPVQPQRDLRGLGKKLLRPFAWLFGQVTALGWLVLLGTAVLLFAGTRLGWDEFLFGGVMLGALFVVAVLLSFGRSTYAVRLDLADQRVTVGQRAIGRLSVTNVGRSRLLPARIELPVGAGAAGFALPSLAAGAKHEEVFAVPTSRRAIIVVGPVWSVRGDALGLIRRQIRWTDPENLFIHPRTVSLASARTGIMRDLEGDATRVLSDNDMSFHALREYAPGDDRRNIHWRSTARFGTLMVRQFEDTRRTHTALAISDNLDLFASDDEFEFAVTVFASLGQQAIREELQITPLAGRAVLASHTPPKFLDDCSGLLATADGDPPAELTKHVALLVPNASLAVLIVGSIADAAQLRAASQHIPTGVRVAVIKCEIDAELSLMTRGMLSVGTLGRGTDLARLLTQLVAA